MVSIQSDWIDAINERGEVDWDRGKAVVICPLCKDPRRPLSFTLVRQGEYELFRLCGCDPAAIVAALEQSANEEPEAEGEPPPLVTPNGNGAHDPFVVPSLLSSPPHSDDEPRQLAPEARYGVAGRVLETIERHTESAPAALLGSFLVGMGNMIGRKPHYWIEGARHGTNIFLCMVGVSSSGRKGTGSNRIEEVISCVDCNWTKNIVRGLSSGEGLIHAVRDARIDQVPVKKAGRHTGEIDDVVVDRGVEDKRCMVREEEFASVLRVMGREGNTLSIIVRNAWDNKRLGTMTKSNRETATDPHISILGHITEIELKRHLTETEAGNGFANRFLWICTHRARILPRGGGRPNLAPLTLQLREIWEAAQQIDEVSFDRESGLVWDAIYQPLSERYPGLLGSVTSRAESQVLRLSVLYAVLDAESAIRLPHLLAAVAFWDYCEKSAAYVFGRATGDDYADIIEEALKETESLTRTEIRDKFGRNALPGRIPKALAALKSSGRADFRLMETGGRPMELWFSLPNDGNDKTTKAPGTHLERARKAASLLAGPTT